MKTKLLTDVELRAHWLKTGGGPCSVPAGTMLTPAARDFLREHCIELCFESAPAAMHIGAPSRPVVRDGQTVTCGELIAEIPEGALGANLHASISGRAELLDGRIRITKQ